MVWPNSQTANGNGPDHKHFLILSQMLKQRRTDGRAGGRTDIPTLQIVSYVADTAVFMSLHKPALTLTAFMSLATVC